MERFKKETKKMRNQNRRKTNSPPVSRSINARLQRIFNVQLHFQSFQFFFETCGTKQRQKDFYQIWEWNNFGHQKQHLLGFHQNDGSCWYQWLLHQRAGPWCQNINCLLLFWSARRKQKKGNDQWLVVRFCCQFQQPLLLFPWRAYLTPAHIRRRRRKLFINFIGNVVHEPFEIFAIVWLFESQLIRDIANWISSYRRFSGVEIFFEFVVQPDFHHPHVILKK